MNMFSPGWPSLWALGNSRASKSTAIWLLIIPIIARALRNIEPTTLEVAKQIRIDLALPFSWKVLFFSALLIGTATLLYHLWCPIAVKEYRDYAAFQRMGKGNRNLVGLFQRFLQSASSYRHVCTKNDALLGFVSSYGSAELEDKPYSDSELEALLDVMEIKTEKEAEAFWHVWHMSERARPVERLFVFLLYCLGFCGLGVIVAQNVLFVWKA